MNDLPERAPTVADDNDEVKNYWLNILQNSENGSQRTCKAPIINDDSSSDDEYLIILNSSNTTKKEIVHMCLVGDSTADRGTFNLRKLFGIIPLGALAGLDDKSQGKRFTNGFAWPDYFSVFAAEKFIMDRLRKKYEDDFIVGKFTSDGLLELIKSLEKDLSTEDQTLWRALIKVVNPLTNEQNVAFNQQPYFRTFAEGGASAYNYKGQFDWNPGIFFSRLLLSNLDEKRQQLLENDLEIGVTKDQKQKTLYIDAMTAGNDFLTVNSEPVANDTERNKALVERAVTAKIKNLTEMIQNDYVNMVIFDCPDLSLTPRFKNADDSQKKAIQKLCSDYNILLNTKIGKIQKSNRQCQIEVYSIAQEFNEYYTHPGNYGISSIDEIFRETDDIYDMFYDQLHLSDRMQEKFAAKFWQWVQEKYTVSEPQPLPSMEADELIEKYNQKYSHHDLLSFESNTDKITYLLNQALYGNNDRIYHNLLNLKWIDRYRNINYSGYPFFAENYKADKTQSLNYSFNEKVLAFLSAGLYILLRPFVATDKDNMAKDATAVALITTGFILTAGTLGLFALVYAIAKSLWEDALGYEQALEQPIPTLKVT